MAIYARCLAAAATIEGTLFGAREERLRWVGLRTKRQRVLQLEAGKIETKGIHVRQGNTVF